MGTRLSLGPSVSMVGPRHREDNRSLMKPPKQTQISTFSYKGQDFDVLVHKNKISYIFEKNGNRYGNAVEVKGRSKLDLVNGTMNLLINFIDTYDATNEHKA